MPPELNNLRNIEVIALQHSRVSAQSGPGGPLSLEKGGSLGLTGSLLPFDQSPKLTEIYLAYNDLGGVIPANFLENVGTRSDIDVDLQKM